MVVSWQCKVLNIFLKMIVRPKFCALAKAKEKTQQIEIIKNIRNQIRPFVIPPPPQATVETFEINDLQLTLVKNKNIQESNRTILYFHGGGYAIGSPLYYQDFAYRLSEFCQAQVILVDYRLAPENPFPCAFEDAVLSYQWVIKHFQQTSIFLGGDSAGGGLALALLIHLNQNHQPMPKGSICFSPWTDLCFTGQSIKENEEKESYLVIPDNLFFLGNFNKKDPRISPYYGEFLQLTPILIQVGKNEILLDDSRNFAQKAKSCNTHVILEIWDEVPHCWQLFSRFLPEGKASLKKAAKFVSSLA